MNFLKKYVTTHKIPKLISILKADKSICEDNIF